MRNIILSLILTVLFVNGYSHMCNDVFMKYKDNLAVKVDIRDGQLRVNKSASFRVYLLNTTDGLVDSIKLEIDSQEFTAKVVPSPGWTYYPILLRNIKVYFEVELTRRKNIPEGKYNIGLRLVDGNNTERIIKAMDINDAMETMEIPVMADQIKPDGEVSASEWGKSLLCTSLYEYRNVKLEQQIDPSQYNIIKVEADLQTRFRFAYDEKNLYCLVDFVNKGDNVNNVAEIYIAKDMNSDPDIFYVDLNRKIVTKNRDTAGIKSAFEGDKAEIEIPLNSIGLVTDKSCYINFRRKQEDLDGKTLSLSYWRGNVSSYMKSFVYPKFVLK